MKRRQLIKWVLSGFLLAILMIGNAWAESPKISYPPVSDWVHEVEWSAVTNPAPNPKSAGTRCLLFESQMRPKKAEEFVRDVELMENNNGVQNSGSLRIGFDPGYQDLCLHRVVIHRDGKTIDRLNRAQVRIIQPEPGLDGDVITGRQTAVLFVEDLRVGDVLEYAYTIRGANPILAGHFYSQFIVQPGSSIDRQLFRVVWDDKAPLYHRSHMTGIEPVIQPLGNGLEYAWNFTNLPAIPSEDYQPASFEAYPYVEVGDFADWKSVVNWALPLYDVNPTNVPAEMLDMIAKWQDSAHADEEKARWALEFVQDNLRYTGIELGPDSYRPTDPVETFQKRYGDCKGKSVLLRFLLQQMNIESYPVLVSSSDHEAIANRLPSPFAFDHCILQIKLRKRTLWVDPTMSHQGGLLWHRYVSPFGKALVIRPDSDALEDVPPNEMDSAWQQKVTSTFTIKAYSSPASLHVRTEYHGASADGMRDDLASTDPNDLAKNYLNYYLRQYPGIASTEPLQIKDSRQANVVTVDEFYTITNFWKRDETAKLWKTSFSADDLYNVLTDPETRNRKTPLALTYPLDRQQDIIVHLPDNDWTVPDGATNIENNAFSFTSHCHLNGTVLTFNYECRTKQAVVPVEAVSGFLAKRAEMDDQLTESLQHADVKPSKGINWLMVVVAIFGAGATAIGCIWYWRRIKANQRTPPPLLDTNAQLEGLGGWLILVAIGLSLGPLLRISTLVQNWESYFSALVWQTVAMPQGASYHPLYGPLLILEMLGNIFFLGLNVLLLCLFFTKRKSFPAVYITFIVGFALFAIMDDVGCMVIPSIRSTAVGKDHSEAIRAIIPAMIWSLYMLKSERVKATFVH